MCVCVDSYPPGSDFKYSILTPDGSDFMTQISWCLSCTHLFCLSYTCLFHLSCTHQFYLSFSCLFHLLCSCLFCLSCPQLFCLSHSLLLVFIIVHKLTIPTLIFVCVYHVKHLFLQFFISLSHFLISLFLCLFISTSLHLSIKISS